MDFTFEDDNRIVPSKKRRRGLSSPTIVENPVKKASRQRVATSSMEADFDRPVERHRRKAPAKVGYLKGGSTRSFSRPRISFNFKLNIYTLGWIIFLLLCLRLVLMDRGVIDFYDKENLIKEKQGQLHQIEQENMAIVEEIEKIKTIPSYQKMLAREHLGVIAKDEYLILFSKEANSPSI